MPAPVSAQANMMHAFLGLAPLAAGSPPNAGDVMHDGEEAGVPQTKIERQMAIWRMKKLRNDHWWNRMLRPSLLETTAEEREAQREAAALSGDKNTPAAGGIKDTLGSLLHSASRQAQQSASKRIPFLRA